MHMHFQAAKGGLDASQVVQNARLAVDINWRTCLGGNLAHALIKIDVFFLKFISKSRSF